MRIKTKNHIVICYGSNNKAYITIRQNQIWEVINKFRPPYVPYWTLKRDNVVINLLSEDYDRLNPEVLEDENDE